MECYEKVVQAKQESRSRQPWQVFISQGCKMRSVIPYCLKMLVNHQKVELVGLGSQISKAISIAEILKRKDSDLTQTTSISYTEFEDNWEPKDKSKGLDALCVTRNVPTIKIQLLKVKGPNDISEEKPAQMEVNETENNDVISKETLAKFKREIRSSLRDLAVEKNSETRAHEHHKTKLTYKQKDT
eukprot:gene8381-14356_t